MAFMINDEIAKQIVASFIEYENRVDEIVWPESSRPKYKLDNIEPTKVLRGLVFDASPAEPIDSDNHEHYKDRRKSYIICISSNNSNELLHAMDVFSTNRLDPGYLASVASIDQIWHDTHIPVKPDQKVR